MRPVVLVVLFLFMFGCTEEELDIVEFDFGYLLMNKDNVTTEGPVMGSITFPRSSTYFHIRANITNTGEDTHYLLVLDQQTNVYGVRLPMYSEERINGYPREWTTITGLSNGTEKLVPLVPGEIKELEQPIFFFNQNVQEGIPPEMLLEIKVVNSTGTVLGSKILRITVSE